MHAIDTMPLPIVLYTPWYKKLLGFAFAIAFTWLGYWMIGEDEPSRKYSVEMIHVIGWVCMLMFAGISLLALKQIFWPKPVMIIDDDGVAVIGALGRSKRIAWEHLEVMFMQRIQYNSILTLVSETTGVTLSIGGMRVPVNIHALQERIAQLAEEKSPKPED